MVILIPDQLENLFFFSVLNLPDLSDSEAVVSETTVFTGQRSPQLLS